MFDRRSLAARCLTLALSGTPLAAAFAQQQQQLDPSRFPAEMRDDVAEIAAMVPSHPHDASVLYQVAHVLAEGGFHDEAMAALERMASLRSGLEPRSLDFSRLSNDPRFVALAGEIRAAHPSVATAHPFTTIEPTRVTSEGIAWSPRARRFYVGFERGTVRALDAQGRARELLDARAAKLGLVLGLRTDDQRDDVWAVSMPAAGTEDVGGLFRFSLSDGRLKRAYPIPRPRNDYLNDVAVAPDGLVYATASISGAVLRLDPATGRVDEFVKPGDAPSANGIAATPDGRALYVATWYAVLHIDRATGRITELAHAPDVASGCIDGLYVETPRSLLGVQNCNHESGRVLRLWLDANGTKITRSEVLTLRDPLAGQLTTGAIVGRSFYMLSRPARFQNLPRTESLQKLRVLRLDLDRS
jgi:sugar lactone lactonase YvrE